MATSRCVKTSRIPANKSSTHLKRDKQEQTRENRKKTIIEEKNKQGGIERKP